MIKDFDRRKKELLDRTTMLEVADALGLEPAGKKDRYCPAHNDTGRPNLHLYDGVGDKNAHCFACNFHADAIDLVAKVKGFDFKESFNFLAGRFGLPPLENAPAKKGQGLGINRSGTKSYPKPLPLPSTPSPTLGIRSNPLTTERLGDDKETTLSKPVGELTDLPSALWRDFGDFASAMAYLDEVADFRRAMRVDRASGRYIVRPPLDWPPRRNLRSAVVAAADGQQVEVSQVEPVDQVASRRPSLRVKVFAALLDLATPSSATTAGEWLCKEKGIELATQDRFGLRFLDEWQVVAKELKDRFGMETLESVGIYGKQKDGKPYFLFAQHRLLFPFFWKGDPVDVQGRNVDADEKGNRFRNTTGANPIPYNAGALLEARATGSPVFVCEGATDTLALAQSGRLVVGIVGTGGFKQAWLEAFAGLDVYLALDSDDAGRKAARNITATFVDAGHRAPKVVKLPNGIKDVNQFFRSMTQ